MQALGQIGGWRTIALVMPVLFQNLLRKYFVIASRLQFTVQGLPTYAKLSSGSRHVAATVF